MKYTSSKPKKSHAVVKIIGIVFIVVLVVAIIMGFSSWRWYQKQLTSPDGATQTVRVMITEGSSAQQIAKILKDKQLIRNTSAFEWYIRLNKLRSKLQAGNYEISSSQSVQEIVNLIANGQVQRGKFTILPGKRIDQIMASFINAGYSKQSVEAAFNPETHKNHPALAYKPVSASLEGYLYPETFQTTDSITPTDIVKQSLDEMADTITPDLIDSFKKQGLTPFQAITLASIVEKEVSNTDDRRMVARVFLNRLKIGMPLGSDVTYHYVAAITGQEPSPSIDSPYNTRKYTGLPPGPISNVSKTSLNAVANPAQNDYLFFVAGDDGKTYYSKTNAEHLELVRQHCKVLCSTY